MAYLSSWIFCSHYPYSLLMMNMNTFYSYLRFPWSKVIGKNTKNQCVSAWTRDSISFRVLAVCRTLYWHISLGNFSPAYCTLSLPLLLLCDYIGNIVSFSCQLKSSWKKWIFRWSFSWHVWADRKSVSNKLYKTTLNSDRIAVKFLYRQISESWHEIK